MVVRNEYVDDNENNENNEKRGPIGAEITISIPLIPYKEPL